MSAGESERCYDGPIMKVRVQFAMDSDLKRRAKKRAARLGLSLSQYLVSLIEGDLVPQETKVGVEAVFNLGSSGGSDITLNKDTMIAEAIEATRRRVPRLSSANGK